MSNIIGYYIVRQKRIPITLCEGLSAGNQTADAGFHGEWYLFLCGYR